MTIELYNVRSGEVLDTVSLDRTGALRFETGLGRGVFARLRRRLPEATDAELLEAGWSNGYLATRSA